MPGSVEGLSESLEDYLETVRELEAGGRAARVRDIAARRSVSMPSVVSALKRLADAGLVAYRAHEYVELTPEGRQAAGRVGQRHSFLRLFLEEVLLVAPAVAEKDACALEHTLSLETLDRFAGFYQFLRSCSPGQGQSDIVAGFRQSCTSGSAGESAAAGVEGRAAAGVRESDLGSARPRVCHQAGSEETARGAGPGPGPGPCERTLLGLRPGQEGRVAGLRAGPEVRRKLIDLGFLPGAPVELEAAGGRAVRLRLTDSRLSLPAEEAAAVVLEPAGSGAAGPKRSPNATGPKPSPNAGGRERSVRV